jgi:hypothetical protein
MATPKAVDTQQGAVLDARVVLRDPRCLFHDEERTATDLIVLERLLYPAALHPQRLALEEYLVQNPWASPISPTSSYEAHGQATGW